MSAKTDTPRYALFAGPYYPDGAGWNHFKQVGSSANELEQIALGDKSIDWYQIVDLSKLKVVKQADRQETIRLTCTHSNTYEAKPISQGELIVSGAYQTPGTYCSDCGKFLGRMPDVPLYDGDKDHRAKLV